MNGTEHVVVGEEVVKAQVLDRSPDPPNRGRVSSKLVLGVDDADLHGSSLPRDRWLLGRPRRCGHRLGARLDRRIQCLNISCNPGAAPNGAIGERDIALFGWCFLFPPGAPKHEVHLGSPVIGPSPPAPSPLKSTGAVEMPALAGVAIAAADAHEKPLLKNGKW